MRPARDRVSGALLRHSTRQAGALSGAPGYCSGRRPFAALTQRSRSAENC